MVIGIYGDIECSRESVRDGLAGGLTSFSAVCEDTWADDGSRET